MVQKKHWLLARGTSVATCRTPWYLQPLILCNDLRIPGTKEAAMPFIINYFQPILPLSIYQLIRQNIILYEDLIVRNRHSIIN
jgi:hypothetical protein